MDTSDNIIDRLAALEAIVMGRSTDARFDRRITKSQLAMRRGTSTRTVDRDVARNILPKPEIENGRLYWWLSAVQQHEREREQGTTRTPKMAFRARRA
jgi:hypothetical protein